MLFRGEELLCDDLEGLGGGGGFPGRAPLLYAEEEGVGVDLFEGVVRFLLSCDCRYAF